MTYLEIGKLEATAAERTPFEYMMVPAFLSAGGLKEVNADYPKMERAGNFPLEELSYGPAFAALIGELEGRAVSQSRGGEVRHQPRRLAPPDHGQGSLRHPRRQYPYRLRRRR